MRSPRNTLLLASAAWLVSALLLAYPTLKWSEKIRANLRAKQASEAFAAGDYRTAFDHAASAFSLNPGDPSTARLRARAALKMQATDAFRLWQPILRDPEVTAEDLSELVVLLAAHRQESALNQVVPELLARDPRNQAGREAYLAMLFKDYQFAIVERLTRAWIDEGATDWFIHRSYAQALVSFSDRQQEGIEHLMALSHNDDTTGLEATRFLLRISRGDAPAGELIDRLQEHPLATREDRLFVHTYRFRTHAVSDFETLESRILDEFDLQLAEDLKTYLGWLARMERFETITQRLTPDDAFQDEDLCRLLLTALIESGRADEAIRLTLEPSIPMGEVPLLLLRARAFEKQEKPADRSKALALAVSVAEIADIPELERELVRSDHGDLLSELYASLMNHARTQPFAVSKRLLSNYRRGFEPELLQALDAVRIVDYEDDAKLLSFIAYLKLLYNRDPFLDTAHKLEDLLTKHPNVLDFRILLALAHQLDGNDEAVAQLRPLIGEDLGPGQPRYLHVAHHFVVHGPANAATGTSGLHFDQLLPRERALLLGY